MTTLDTFKLFFVNRTASSIMLKEELEALKNRFLNRLEIYYFLTKEFRQLDLLNGRLSDDKLEIITETLCEIQSIDDFYICGPEDMIFLIRDFLLFNKSILMLSCFITSTHLTLKLNFVSIYCFINWRLFLELRIIKSRLYCIYYNFSSWNVIWKPQ